MNSDIDSFVVGKKQILRELRSGNVAEIRIAQDVDTDYMETLKTQARTFDAPYLIRGTMRELADEFGVDVPTGAVAKLKN